MILLGATLPSYSSDREKRSADGQEIIRADDPKNKQRVKDFFDSIKD